MQEAQIVATSSRTTREPDAIASARIQAPAILNRVFAWAREFFERPPVTAAARQEVRPVINAPTERLSLLEMIRLLSGSPTQFYSSFGNSMIPLA